MRFAIASIETSPPFLASIHAELRGERVVDGSNLVLPIWLFAIAWLLWRHAKPVLFTTSTAG